MSPVHLDVFRAFMLVLEEGSLSRAAVRLHLAQSTLTRQMATLEQEVGARLLERTARGVVASAAGQMLAERLRQPLRDIEAATSEARSFARGKRRELRIGFLQSIIRSFLQPALAHLRAAQPKLKVRLSDLCAGSQMRALREGTIDVALIGQEGRQLAREFYTRRIASSPVVVALPDNHALAARAALRLRDLRHERFVGADDTELPGRDRWIAQLCRRAGFRPRFTPPVASFAEMIATVVNEDAVALLPEIARDQPASLVVMRPIEDAFATWDFMAVWQRGRTAAAVSAFLDALARAQPAVGVRKLKVA